MITLRRFLTTNGNAAKKAFQDTIFRRLMSIKYRNLQKSETIQSRRLFSRKSGMKTFKMSNAYQQAKRNDASSYFRSGY